GAQADIDWPGLRLDAAGDGVAGDGAQLGRLTLTMFARDDRLAAHLAFQRDLFDRTTMERLLAHFETLLAAAVAEPERALDDLALLAPAERHQVACEWNDTRAPIAWEGGVHRAFERRAAQCPDAVAVIWGGCGQPEGRWTYGELNHGADRVAHWLWDLGVKPEQVVGLCVERSPRMVSALLGILKAGASFLPLSPASPRERLAYQLADAGAVAVLATASSAAPVPAGPWKTVWLDPEHRLPPPSVIRNPRVPVAPDQLSYVIHTSGSTGQPKGVQVSHRSVDNIVASFVASYGLSAADRVLQQTTITFDVAVNEIFPILTTGGALVLVPTAAELNFERLAALVAAEGVTILGTAPSVLARWNEVAERGLGRLRLILSGGEALSWSDVDRLIATAAVINGYGPTEATVCALSYDLRTMTSERRSAIPLGRPLANYEVLICDRAGRLLGVGQPGELCIAGPG
ncbi:MAG: AMP-binding protein, partial [bacterium]|nr:AMP-binding protein [bacterium]